MKPFVEPYQVKGIILINTIELDLPTMIKIHLVVNVSKVQRYKNQVEEQRKEQLALVVIEEEEKYKVEKILNKKKFRGKDWYLVQQKGYIVEEDTWELRKNLGNIKDLYKNSRKNMVKLEEQEKEKTMKKRKENYWVGIQ